MGVGRRLAGVGRPLPLPETGQFLAKGISLHVQVEVIFIALSVNAPNHFTS